MRERLCFVCGTELACQRSTRLYCANACRQSAYRRRKTGYVRRRRAPDTNVSPAARARLPHVVRPTVSLAHATVRPVPLREARPIIEAHEPMCGVGTLAFGLFLGEALASVVVFGVHPASNFSPARYDGTLALLRGVTLPWAPRNCGSKLIRGAMAMLPSSYSKVVAFADATLGERGIIYRAAGFEPLGASRGSRRILVHHQGRVLSERTARRRFGTISAPRLAALGLKVETVPRRSRWIVCRARAVTSSGSGDDATGGRERGVAA
jgi:hypothetical protein